jgi:hypothetical protein
MHKYRVFVHGVNFQMHTHHQEAVELLGFYTTVFVEAESREKAESAAVDLLRDSPNLREDVLNPLEDPPRLLVEEIEEIADWPPDTTRPLTGFAFYDDPDVSWRQSDEHAKNI